MEVEKKEAIADLLANFVFADGTADPAELDCIKEISKEYGIDETVMNRAIVAAGNSTDEDLLAFRRAVEVLRRSFSAAEKRNLFDKVVAVVVADREVVKDEISKTQILADMWDINA